MKILKLKSILFSLMAIAMVTVFLTSCDKDEIQPEATMQTIEQSTLRSDFDALSLDEKTEKLESLSLEQLAALGFEQSVEEINLRGCGSWFTYHVETGYCWTKNYQARVCGNWYFETRVKTYPYC